MLDEVCAETREEDIVGEGGTLKRTKSPGCDPAGT